MEDDLFAYDRMNEINSRLGKDGSLKQYLMSEQTDKAMDIFNYIGDVESTL